MVSPLSIQMALSLAANGADAEEFDEILALYTNSTGQEGLAELNDLNRYLLNELPKVDQSTHFNIANSIWIDKSLNFNAQFMQACRDYYLVDAMKYTAFSESGRKAVNNWVEKQTNGMIKDFLRDVPPSASLVNACSFEAQWNVPFKPNNTSDGVFHNADGSQSTVKMMMAEDLQTTYIDNDALTAAILEYGNKGFDIVLFIPKEGKSFSSPDVIESISTLSDVGACRLDIRLPKFDMTSEYNLVPYFTALGLDKALSDMGHFPGVIDNDDFKLTTFKHKTYINVNENGTKAAAATLLGGASGFGSTNDLVMNFDRPFGFVIRETSTGAILFIGKVTSL